MHAGADRARRKKCYLCRSRPNQRRRRHVAIAAAAAERIALDFAIAAASQPNAVTDEMFGELRVHWSDGQVVEITAVVALFGFMNRWNDTMATPLEAEPVEVGERHLARHGWAIGKHKA